MNPDGSNHRTALLYEPRVEGHHLVWLRFIVEDLLSAGWRLTLAVDTRPESFARIRERLGRLLENVSILSAWEPSGRKAGGKGAAAVAECLSRAGANFAFLNTFDEIASLVLRRAAMARMPPASLQGRIGGIYVRPRFLAGGGFSLNNWLKAAGFSRLMRGDWFSHLLFLDPRIQETCQTCNPRKLVFSLPDPCPDDFVSDNLQARRHFEIPEEKKVLLFYGGAYRRKGLHVAVKALLGLPTELPVFLLCAGQQPNDARTLRELEALVSRERARVISRYVFEPEEKLLFAASDIVLLPYLKHFGNSAVLSRAAGAGKMVIASDEELVGWLVRKHDLGLLFRSGDVSGLQQSITQAIQATPTTLARWRDAGFRYARHCSRAEFRRVLVNAFEQAFARSKKEKQGACAFSI